MSNNKQTMKLYTEEQLTKYLLDEGIMELSDLANNLIPSIELPSDEEIEERYYKELEERRQRAKNFTGQVAGRHPDMFGISEVHHMVTGYLECVRWMRDKIQGGNK